MTQVMLSAYSKIRLEADCARLEKLNWTRAGDSYCSGLVWYQAVTKE
jgi:hypothetical protein